MTMLAIGFAILFAGMTLLNGALFFYWFTIMRWRWFSIVPGAGAATTMGAVVFFAGAALGFWH